MIFQRLAVVVGVVLWLSGCNPEEKQKPDLEGIAAPVKIERLESALFSCRNEGEVLELLRKNPALTKVYFSDYPVPDSQLAGQLYRNVANPALRSFRMQLDSVFADADQRIGAPLETAFRHLKYYYPEFRVPRVVTMVTGFMGNDLYVSDSLIVIGLDYFGGPQVKFRPDVYNYQLARYQKPYIVPAILFFLSRNYNRVDPADKTLLADMVWYGKGYEFVKQVLPETPDSLIIGYSERDLVRTYNSQTDIWAYLTSNKLLYESTELKKQKYVGERPFTGEIGEDVPGGIGRWVGWRIVSRYRTENDKLKLPDLMAQENARLILEQSGYKGQVDE